MDSRPLGFPVILLNPIVSSVAEVKFSVCEQKNLHRYLTRDKTPAFRITVLCLALRLPCSVCCNANIRACDNLFPACVCVLGEATIKRWEASGDNRYRNHDTGDPEASSCGKVYG